MNPEQFGRQLIDASQLKRLLCYESQHQSQSNEKSLEQFDYEKAVSNYLGTQSTFKPVWPPTTHPENDDSTLPYQPYVRSDIGRSSSERQ